MTDSHPPHATVAVLGAGALGAAMAGRLGERGHHVRLWNRTSERARAAAERAPGVRAVEGLRDAVHGSAVVITVLRDGDAVAAVMAEAVGELANDGVWVQASTVGPASARALRSLAHDHDVGFLDAPVSGSTEPARRGTLVWLVAGSEDALSKARPVLEDLGSTVLHVGSEVEGSALKLAVNAWMTAATVAMSDVLGLCDALGVSHESFLAAINAGPLAMPYELQKARLMDEGAYAPGFSVELALKDVELAAACAPPTPLLAVVRDRLKSTAAAGHAGDDLAALDYLRKRPG